MDDIRRLLRAASNRLVIADFLRTLVVFATAAAVTLAAVVAVEKLGPWTFDWQVIVIAAAGLSVLGSGLVAWARRARGITLADEIDRRAGLRETLSTALAHETRTDAWSAAVRETAAERSRRVVLRDAVPIGAPRGWRVPVVILAVAGFALWLAPRHDLSGMLARAQDQDEQQAEIRATALEIKSNEDRLREILENTPAELEEDKPTLDDPADPGEPKSADELKRSALKKLTKLGDELNDLKNSDSAKQLEAIQQSMKRLKTPGPGPAEEFARSLARGKFADAKEALDELAKQVESGEMDAEQKSQAAEQLKALAEQMEQLAEQKEQMEEALKQAGMSEEQASKAAADPEALQNALDQMGGMSQQQKDALMSMAQSQGSASEAMQSMAQSMSQMAQAMQNSQDGQAGQDMQQAMQQMSDQLSQCEMASAEMASINQALSECQGQMAALGQSMCENPNGSSSPFGNGLGATIGSSDGESEADPDAPFGADFMFKGEKTDVPNRGGPIIGSTLVYGAQVRGEATAEFGAAASASAVEAAEAIDSMRVPREYHDAVRHYFGRLEKAAKDNAGEKAESEGE